MDMQHIDPQWAWSAYEPDEQSPWNAAAAAHLFRRAGFAATRGEIQQAVASTPQAVVESLFAETDTREFEETSSQLAAAVLATGKPENLAPWWLHRMLYSPQPLREKMTLFWHGHFATSAEKVRDAQAMYAQNVLLREHALGDFAAMVQQISRDPAMLIYLDSATNRKAHPNENYARELMELFCLGEGNYSESDVQQLARCFTGWEIRRHQFRFNRFQHDSGEKTFLGRTGRFGGEDAVQIVLEQPAAARFIVRKLFRFFIWDEPEPDDALLEPLAEPFRAGGLQIAPLVQRILDSQLFFSPLARARKIRSPVELAIGLLRALEGTANLQRLATEIAQLGQSVFFPPSVKGWEGGRAWINSATLIARANLVTGLTAEENTRFGGGSLADWARRQGASSPEAFVPLLSSLLLAVPLPAAVEQQLVNIARESGAEARAYAHTLGALGALPEFQLS